jgi:hypothetical protein
MLQCEHISRFRFENPSIIKIESSWRARAFGKESISSKLMNINLLVIQYISTCVKEGKTLWSGYIVR